MQVKILRRPALSREISLGTCLTGRILIDDSSLTLTTLFVDAVGVSESADAQDLLERGRNSDTVSSRRQRLQRGYDDNQIQDR